MLEYAQHLQLVSTQKNDQLKFLFWVDNDSKKEIGLALEKAYNFGGLNTNNPNSPIVKLIYRMKKV